MPRKCILILLDGIGDRSHAQLGYQTPLQAAQTPSLDRMAALGANGLYHAWAQGQALSSEDAHFAMFGYERSEFPGRGALEALGAGVTLAPRDVAVLAHVASVRESDGCLVLEEGTPWASNEEAEAVLSEIGEYEAGVLNSPIQLPVTSTLAGGSWAACGRPGARRRAMTTDASSMNASPGGSDSRQQSAGSRQAPRPGHAIARRLG